MSETAAKKSVIDPDQVILVTGASGFIGPKVVESLLRRGFRRIRCLARPTTQPARLATLKSLADGPDVQLVRGNLLSMEDCVAVTRDAAVVIHLAAGRGEKSYPDAFMNSVVTTRNLLEACLLNGKVKRFVNVSSFSVYKNDGRRRTRLLDESCPMEQRPEERGEAYCFAKTKQDELVLEYGQKHGIPTVILRPGVVYGPGNLAITGRVGIGTFGIFLHLGGSNRIPFTFVDNCAEAIALAGVTDGIDGQIFNVVDDDLPSSGQFLRLYKKHVRPFKSLYLPKAVSYTLCNLWESYCNRSNDQIPRAFNRSRWNSLWRRADYSNQRLKAELGWQPVVSTQEGLRIYFDACRAEQAHA